MRACRLAADVPDQPETGERITLDGLHFAMRLVVNDSAPNRCPMRIANPGNSGRAVGLLAAALGPDSSPPTSSGIAAYGQGSIDSTHELALSLPRLLVKCNSETAFSVASLLAVLHFQVGDLPPEVPAILVRA